MRLSSRRDFDPSLSRTSTFPAILTLFKCSLVARSAVQARLGGEFCVLVGAASSLTPFPSLGSRRVAVVPAVA